MLRWKSRSYLDFLIYILLLFKFFLGFDEFLLDDPFLDREFEFDDLFFILLSLESFFFIYIEFIIVVGFFENDAEDLFSYKW